MQRAKWDGFMFNRRILAGALTVSLTATAAISATAFLTPVSLAQQPGGPVTTSTAHQSQVRYDGNKVVRVLIRNQADLDAIDRISTDCWSESEGIGGQVDYRVTPGQFKQLQSSGLTYEVMINDVQQLIDFEDKQIAKDHQNGKQTPQSDWYDDFKDLDDVNTHMNDLAAQFPDLVSVFPVGTSIENRTCYGMHIQGAGGGQGKPAVVYQGCQHAREWITPMASMYLAETLLNGYGNDPTLTSLVDDLDIYVVPVVNIDGYVYTWTNDRLWRKNRRNNGNGSYGVDLNRNWGYEWGGEGSSGRTGSDVYRGTAPFSEPETQYMRDLLNSLPTIAAHLDIHSYGQLILSPWGYTVQLPPDDPIFDAIGAQMETDMEALYGKNYTHGPTYTTIYPCSGIANDWSYGALGALGFGVELRDTGQYGFVLPANQIIPASEECFAGAIDLAEYVQSQGQNDMTLNVGALNAGQNGDFDVTNGDANTMTYLAYSISGTGSTYVAALNVTLGLAHPVQAGTGQMSDGNGAAHWTLPIPSYAAGRTVWFQSAQFQRVSNVVQTTIN